MERSFPVILCELRKERGLSQKEAAAKLGVSQALLSHYEKGIRECGQSFLIKVADFYGVTCDYLLGRTATKNYRGGLDDIAEANKNDETPSIGTFIKAGLTISDYMSKNHTVGGVKLDLIMAIEVYKLILEQAAAGNLPKNWAGRAYFNGEICCTPVYKAIIEGSADAARKPAKNKNPMPDAPIPESVRTLVSVVEDYVVNHCTSNTPPVPARFIK